MNIKLQALILGVLFYLFHEPDEIMAEMVRGRLKKCSKCPPGWGVARKCTKKVNTVCKPCAKGKTYSSQISSSSQCWLCSKCGVGLYEAHKCIPTRDTVCNECLSFIDHKNFTRRNDFAEKCSYMFLKRRNGETEIFEK